MPTLALDSLDPHPDNANRMPLELQAKLGAHIRATGEYPPLIVRPHPSAPDRFQILGGHHRAIVLRELGYEHARCEIWTADDDRAALLLLTLNRLHGEDDPRKRGDLLARLNARIDLNDLARLLPDTAKEIRALMDLSQSPPPLAVPPKLEDMPYAVTFFLSRAQRDQLLDRLDEVNRDRSTALVQLLALDACQTSEAAA
jgi:ParB family chromosome partitioning protein